MSCELYKNEPRKCLLRRAQARCTGTPFECSTCERIPQITLKEPLPVRKTEPKEKTMKVLICEACGQEIKAGDDVARGVHKRCYQRWYSLGVHKPPFKEWIEEQKQDWQKKTFETPASDGEAQASQDGATLVVDGVTFDLVAKEVREPAISISKDGINILAGARKAFNLDAYTHVFLGVTAGKIAFKFLQKEHPQARKLCKHVSKMQICARAVRKQFKQRGPFTLVATDQADTFVAEVG